MVVKLDDVTICVDRLVCVCDDIRKLARFERRRQAKGIGGRPMTQYGFALDGMRKGIPIVLQQTDFVDGTQGDGRLALMFQEGQHMASQDLLLFVDRHGDDLILWWWEIVKSNNSDWDYISKQEGHSSFAWR
jgi:hypothetical protein